MIVHGIYYGSQPYVAFYCDRKNHRYVGPQKKDNPDDVHNCDGRERNDPDELYTFSDSKITCEDCLKAIKEK